MIASRAVPAPRPAHIGVSQTSYITVGQDFADPLRMGHPWRTPAHGSGWRYVECG
jgi:hypothetical protein